MISILIFDQLGNIPFQMHHDLALLLSAHHFQGLLHKPDIRTFVMIK